MTAKQPRNRTGKAYVYSPSFVPNHYTVTVYTSYNRVYSNRVYTVRFGSPSDARIDYLDRTYTGTRHAGPAAFFEG